MPDLQERNQQIAAALARARRRMRRSLDEVAAHLGTTRVRYTKIENGATPVTAAELEELVDYLDISPVEVWPVALILRSGRQINVDAEPGEYVQVLVRISEQKREPTE